jgi:hypothetical protein
VNLMRHKGARCLHGGKTFRRRDEAAHVSLTNVTNIKDLPEDSDPDPDPDPDPAGPIEDTRAHFPS